MERERVMLSWFVDAETAECSIKSATPISSDKVMGRTGTSAATGDNVSLLCLRKYLSADAWAMVQSVVNEVNSEPVWYCVTCTGCINDDENISVACARCLQWTQFKCDGMKSAPKGRCWFCANCKSGKRQYY
ncbi:hypothetical protein NP493_6644g00005 [Ridgeia piscesae]|nr:hypothetical protein NP493_6644g00005 [Ridgeia piscesae]